MIAYMDDVEAALVRPNEEAWDRVEPEPHACCRFFRSIGKCFCCLIDTIVCCGCCCKVADDFEQDNRDERQIQQDRRNARQVKYCRVAIMMLAGIMAIVGELLDTTKSNFEDSPIIAMTFCLIILFGVMMIGFVYFLYRINELPNPRFGFEMAEMQPQANAPAETVPIDSATTQRVDFEVEENSSVDVGASTSKTISEVTSPNFDVPGPSRVNINKPSADKETPDLPGPSNKSESIFPPTKISGSSSE